MHHVDLIPAAIAVLAVLLVTASPVLRLPVAVPLAVWSLAEGVPLRVVALLGACGVVLGCALLAVHARARQGAGRGARTRGAASQMADRLARSSQYGGLTFSAAAMPLIPARTLFPLLGTLRLPLRYALAGAFVGRLPLLLVTTWIVRGVARAVSSGDHQAAQAAGIFAIAWVVLGTLQRIDSAAWESERRIRLRTDDDPRMAAMFTSFGDGNVRGARGDRAAGQLPPEPLGEDEIEGVLLGEEEDEPGQPRG